MSNKVIPWGGGVRWPFKMEANVDLMVQLKERLETP